MFVLKNAWAALGRRKWRTALTALLALIITFASFVSLAVAKANDTANGSELDAQKATAAVRLSDKARAKYDGTDPKWAENNHLNWDDYTKVATAVQTAGLQFQYTLTDTVPVRQTNSIKAIAGSDDPGADKTGGELLMRSFYTLDAAKDNSLGAYKVVEGKHLKYSGGKDNGVLISRDLATLNKLKVGDKFKVAEPGDKSKTHELTVRGIYEYTAEPTAADAAGKAASLASPKLSKDNRDNAIYTTYYTFYTAGLDASDGKGWAKPDLDIVFQLSSKADYTKFEKAFKKAKLDDKYVVSSPSLDEYRASIAPLGAFNDRMRVTSIAVWAVGGLLLLALTLSASWFGRREETATALLVGVSKGRLGWQFMVETFVPTLFGLAIGAVAGGFAAGPIGRALADGHATPVNGTIIWQVVGGGLAAALALAIVAALGAAAFDASRIFEARTEAKA